MYDKKMFGELVFYLEACEAGSVGPCNSYLLSTILQMFEGLLPNDVNILAVTASNATESSWGTYCDDPVIDTCLGDLFSINWMEDSDAVNISNYNTNLLVISARPE